MKVISKESHKTIVCGLRWYSIVPHGNSITNNSIKFNKLLTLFFSQSIKFLIKKKIKCNLL